MFIQDLQAVGINLYLPFNLHPSAFKAKIEATDATEQTTNCQHINGSGSR